MIAVDNRSTGRSAKPPGPYSIGQMAADAVGLMDRLLNGGHLAPLLTQHHRVFSEITAFLTARS